MARDEAKWAYWTKQIKDWQASGLSRNAYCKREGLKPTTFDYWRPLITLVHAEGNAVNQSMSGNDIRLVPVKVVAPGGPMAVGHPGPAPPRRFCPYCTARLDQVEEPIWLGNAFAGEH